MKFICFNDVSKTRINLENIVSYHVPKTHTPSIIITHCGGTAVASNSNVSQNAEIWLAFESEGTRDLALKCLDNYCL